MARALVPALVVLGLVGVVAIAATGTTSSGTGETRPPADVVLDTIVSVGLVALIPALAIFLWAFTQRKHMARELARHRTQRRGGLTAFVFIAMLFGVAAYYRFRAWDAPVFGEEEERAFPGNGIPEPVPPGPGELPAPREPEFAWLPTSIIVGLVIVAIVAYVIAGRRAARPLDADEELAAQLAAALDESLDALRAEPDPRRAVIAAYARLELVLAANELARREAETPNEYLARILDDLDVERRSVERLTGLFTEAKFSSHAVDAAMKEEAIDALSTVRDELRARREAERAETHAASTPREAGVGGASS